MAAAAAATATAIFLSLLTTAYSAIIYTSSITPTFNTSRFLLIDNIGPGDFLRSINQTYTASIRNPKPTSTSFYLVIYHTASDTVVWAANRNRPISDSGKIRLSFTGITIHNDSGQSIWSTPALNSKVAYLQLLDSGNLILADRFNKTLWQTFDHPTDTIVAGQRLPVGKPLTATTSDSDYSEGGYTFTLTSGDGILRWQNMTYYTLLMDTRFIPNSNPPNTYLMVNGSGLYVFGDPESKLAITVLIQPADEDSDYRILKITNKGHLIVSRYINRNWVTDFLTPSDSCQPPSQCGKFGLCSTGSCSCPPAFRTDPVTKPGCSVSDKSFSLPESESCRNNKSNSLENYVYVQLGNGVKYVPVDFMDPVKTGVSLSTCKDMCSESCECLGLFHGNQLGSCYLVENHFGSVISNVDNKSDDNLGYVKAIRSLSSGKEDNDSNTDFPVIVLILLPALGVFGISFLAFWMCRRYKNNKMKQHSKKSSDSDDIEMFSIAGLPVRFDYEDLVEATVDFSTRIGSGGFGTVYKGVLEDKTVVAVKKINALGAQGKKEFGTEIAIIGNIHHVNLVKLKGFCAHGRERFLVYEYMNRGSLDRTLFSPGPPMEWRERFDIAVGTARGLAYLHSECEHKIIHCDVKPENILLSDNMQVKISDFGLSKLLSPEQSGLFTTMRGTRGYLAPEWLTNTAISDKTDVYSYGMVLLELIQGRKNCVQAPSHDSGNPSTSTDGQSSISSGSHNRPRARAFYFPLLALEMHEEGRYLDLVEPRLAGRVTNAEAEKLVKVALSCLHEDPSLRPTMANVVAMLEGTLPVCEPRLESLSFLRFYGRRFTEPSTAVTGAEIELPSGFMAATIDSSSPSASPNSFSYMSSQQVSGPR